jgi:hypothetical protein
MTKKRQHAAEDTGAAATAPHHRLGILCCWRGWSGSLWRVFPEDPGGQQARIRSLLWLLLAVAWLLGHCGAEDRAAFGWPDSLLVLVGWHTVSTIAVQAGGARRNMLWNGLLGIVFLLARNSTAAGLRLLS